jgi:phenylalanyl-tRNA synthetase beta chain
LQKHPAGKAYAHLLEKEEKYPLFVDAKKQILSMPPIINSQETGQVTTKTNALFVECSGYDIPTLNAVLSVIVTTLAEMGGSIEAVDIQDDHKHVTPNLHPQKIKISKEAIGNMFNFEKNCILNIFVNNSNDRIKRNILSSVQKNSAN